MSGKHQAEVPSATVKFPHRSRRGILLGLTAPQLLAAGLTGLLLLDEQGDDGPQGDEREGPDHAAGEDHGELLPRRQITHPLGCHRPRVPDRIVFDKLLARLVLGGTYQQHADHRVSATTLRSRRDEWIAAGVFTSLHQAALDAYDQAIGLDLEDLAADGCIVKAPSGGENTGPSPVDRGKSGTKRSLLVEGTGLPIGCVLASANRHDSPLLRPTLETLGRFGFYLPDRITVHLDSGYDSRVTRDLLTELGCGWRIAPKGAFVPINHTRRWVVERTNSWHTRGFKSLAIVTDRSSVVQAAWVALASAVIIIRRLIREAWVIFRWHTRPVRRP